MSRDGEIEILLVEDNCDDVDLTLRALHKAIIVNRVKVARDGVEALAFIFGDGEHDAHNVKNVPRLILLDLKLPKIDGLEVLQRLKSDPRTRPIPIVILTSSREQRDVVEGYQLGVNSYIVKPVNFEGFVEAVGKLGVYWLHLNHPPV
jgi:two-component system response regulator